MEFIQSIQAHDEAIVLGTVVTYDLPVNPLSHIMMTLKGQRLAMAVTDVPPSLGLVATIARIEVLYKGSAVFSMSGIDAFACGLLVSGFETWGVNAADTENAEWSQTLLVSLTRILYSPMECFPRTTRGELVLQITYADANAEFDDLRLQIETVELPDATPSQFIKQTTLSATPTANVPFDVALPIGNPISELVIWQHQIQVADSDTAGLDKLEILMDNKNHFYPESFIEVLQNMTGRMRPPPGYWGGHTHKLMGATFAQGDQTSAQKPENHPISCWLHLPFDIFRNGEYALQTAGRSDVSLRMDVDAHGAFRIIPVEIVSSQGSV